MALVDVTGTARAGKWALFTLPFVVVLREGLEAVVFVGGVSLGQSARSIPIAAIVGIICGLVCGILIYTFASRTSKWRQFWCNAALSVRLRLALSVFLIVMTNFILVIGAGFFSKAVGAYQENAFNHLFVLSFALCIQRQQLTYPAALA
jgi:high-affinity iron transporter